MLRCWIRTVHLLLAILFVENIASRDCKFDALKPNKVAEASVQYLYKRDSELTVNRGRRQAVRLEDFFKPIRFQTYYTNFTHVDRLQRQRLKRVIDNAVFIASQLFSGILVSIIQHV
jgi:hypothetical protein